MARDDMSGSEFQSMVGYQPTKGGHSAKLRAAESAHKSEWSDHNHAAKVLNGLHDTYHASNGPAGIRSTWHERVGTTAKNIAGLHARATGQSTAQVLQNHGFHPITGQSTHPSPSSPTHEWVPGTQIGVRKI